MEMETLLEKNRTMHHLMQRATVDALEIDYAAQRLQDIMGCSVYIVARNGELLGMGDDAQLQLFSLDEIEKHQVSAENMNWIFSSTNNEINQKKAGCYFDLIPVIHQTDRLGTFICAQKGQPLPDDLLLFAEYGATLAAVQMMRTANQKAENEARKKNVVQLALEVLSYSELEAVKYIFNEIEGNEGFLVASKLAEEYKLTRSVIVNALRKLESAGVIDARSLGMKGTYIKILNDYLYEELAAI